MIDEFQQPAILRESDINFPRYEKQDFKLFEFRGKCACSYKIDGDDCFYSHYYFEYPRDLDLFEYILQNARTQKEYKLAFRVASKLLKTLPD